MVAGTAPCPCGNCKPGEIIPDNQNGATMNCDDSPISDDLGKCVPCGGTIDVGVGVEPVLTPGGSREIFYVDAKTGDALWDVSYDTAFVKAVKVAVNERSLVVSGSDCHLAVPR